MVTNNPRMTVSHNGVNTWKLHIRDVQRNDSGHYMCQINTEPMVSQIGMLEVGHRVSINCHKDIQSKRT